ncbi:MAG TPA: GlsB/YeaQ/YmgE family stress response membrane protein [Ktedonobacterales bacterium]|nr:GlsB/YeaQ/YmgE family stress response membrane protein [Ktedonobacterales bacterium]
MLSLLIWVLIGGLAGWLAGLVARRPSSGCIGDIVVGMAGAIMGGFMLSLLLPREYAFAGLSLGSLLMALLGAITLLLVLRAVGWGAHAKKP